MSIDGGKREPSIPGADLWKLPKVLSINAVQVRYREPKVHYVGSKRVEYREAVELIVQTSGEFPARAFSPALFIGDSPIIDYEVVGENLYRFYAFEFKKLKEDAPISIGWPQFPEQKKDTKLRFKVRGKKLK